MSSKVAVLGHTGRLGSELVKAGYIPLDADITSLWDLQEKIAILNPDTIINCASITNVDECEDVLKELATEVNDVGAWNLRTVFKGRIIHISTDFIFDGRGGPYTEQATPNPLSHYGKTKYAGEQQLLKSLLPVTIIRTTLLYGVPNFPDFVTAIRTKLESDIAQINVTNSISGSPTYVPHLVHGIKRLLELEEKPKIINISGTDVLSKYEFALMIASVFGYDKERIIPVASVRAKAVRPNHGGFRLSLAKRLGIPLYSAIEGLMEMKNG